MRGKIMPDQVKTEDEAKQDVATAKAEETLIEETQKRLDILNGVTSSDEEDDDTDDDKQAEDDKGDDDSTPDKDDDEEDDDEEDDDEQAEEDDDDDDSTPEKDKDETGDKDDSKNKPDSDEEEVTLNDAYYRAAISQEWTPDEIKDFFEADPELAIKTFAKIHASTNKISSEFARLGRVQPAKSQEAKTAIEANKAKADDGIDLAALKEQYGEDSAVVKAFTVMQTKLDTAREAMPDKQEQQQEEIDPIILGRIEKFWVDPAMKPYAEFYGEGKDEAKLTIGQSDNRYKVLETADSIVLGCQTQGRKITLEQALESAHLLVSESVRESAIRKELTTKIKKRAKGVSLKPSKSKKAPEPKDKKLDEKGLIDVTAIRLQKTFKT